MTTSNKEQFLNVDKKHFYVLFSKNLNCYDRLVYFTICARATFKYQIFGIYKEETFTTLKNSVFAQSNSNDDFYKDITALKRSLAKLEKNNLIKVLSNKNLIISLDTKQTIEQVFRAIALNVNDFNIYAKRIAELEKAFNLKIYVKTIEQEKEDSKEIAEIFYKEKQEEEDFFEEAAKEFFKGDR
ncbi:hypothetical protein [Acidovorax sp. NCPPB 3576]|uniref:hypothetical protein n=1 Tax=Acidovorax sp. NCPPB 3576 TaxID=2940488 RepID=UPI00234B9782|nr:hypothetical protein [Acidovorax sp. NCPPB 3576]WCM90655.1 hypothetical protein M5C98_11835 [Acidovorax sp. NCPPB 3576]